MTRIPCAQGRWRIDGHPFLVICGEIDYFRVHRNDWADRLGRLKANGANAVATYIPWLLHEPAEGRFDFTTYDLAAFIDACAAAGLWLIVRPEAYVYSELVCDGLPQWLWADYPALRAKRLDGSDHGRSAISYTYPNYRTHAARWYAAALPLLVPRQAHHGGPIMAMQVDNELLGVCSDDRNETIFGIGRPTGCWPEVVASRGTLGAANAAYGTAADSFALIRPPVRAGSSDSDRRLNRDWQSCTLAAVAVYSNHPGRLDAPGRCHGDRRSQCQLSRGDRTLPSDPGAGQSWFRHRHRSLLEPRSGLGPECSVPAVAAARHLRSGLSSAAGVFRSPPIKPFLPRLRPWRNLGRADFGVVGRGHGGVGGVAGMEAGDDEAEPGAGVDFGESAACHRE